MWGLQDPKTYLRQFCFFCFRCSPVTLTFGVSLRSEDHLSRLDTVVAAVLHIDGAIALGDVIALGEAEVAGDSVDPPGRALYLDVVANRSFIDRDDAMLAGSFVFRPVLFILEYKLQSKPCEDRFQRRWVFELGL